MASISFYVGPPISEVEWKTFIITVRLTYSSASDSFSKGDFIINLKYGSTTVWTETRSVSGLAPAPLPQNLDEIFTIGIRYIYLKATIEAIFDPEGGGTTVSTTSSPFDITPAFREFTGGPFGRSQVEGCRWHQEEITVTMKESSVGSVIPTYGQKVESGTYVTYGLTSSDGFTFKEPGTLASITGIQFSGGSATFVLTMDNEVTGGTFTFTDQEPGWSADTYTSDPIDVVNPDFIWQNIYDISNEATAYDSINNGRIDADNPFNTGNPPINFPSPNWSVTADPSGTAIITHGNFASGILNNIDIDYQAVTASSAHLKLEYSPDSSFLANSDDFDNISPSFLFSSGPFARSIPRFFNGEIASFNITAQNKTGGTVTNLPSTNWNVTGFSAPVPGFSFASGIASGISGTFPTGAIGMYSFTVQRSTETSLTGSSLPLPMVSQVSINPLTPVGSDITVSGNASSDGVHTINVTITITGPTGSTQIVSTDSSGAYSHTFTSLSGGAYNVTVKETDDPGTSSQNTGSFNIAIMTPPEINISLTDDPAGVDETVFDLDSILITDEPPLAIHANRNLNVTITASTPGPSSPTASLTKPDGSNVALVFAGLTSTINQATMNINGIYIIRVNDYTDGNGQTAIGITRRFIISSSPVIQTLKIEGWGYYPREEGACSNCPEQSAPISTPSWVESGGAAVSATLSNTLTITSAGAVSLKNYIRTYNYIFENDGKPDDQVGTSYAYIEAGLKVNVTSSGDTLSAKDQNNNDFDYKSTGVGLLLKNGPYKFLLTLIDVQTGLFIGKRLAVRIFDPDNDKFFISTSVIDWETDYIIIKINKVELTGVQNYVVSYKAMNSILAFSSSGLSIPVHLLSGDTTSNFDTSKVGFGVFENNNQNISSQWEFVRYAFYDAGFELTAGDSYKIGLEKTQRDGETDFYRSPNILINASAETQPVIGANQISSIIYRNIPTRFNTFNIPVKVRYSIADWDDSAEESTDGFFRPGFVNYYETLGQFNVLNGTLSSKAEMVPLSGITTGNISWNFVHDATRLARRIFIIAIVDAPLLPCPTVIKSITTNDYLFDDSPAKTDLRCGVREFLPDFYIRDHATDDGSAVAGGSSSPDITLGHFLGDGSTYDPNDVPTTGGQDAVDPRYPAGFARGETPVLDPGGAFYTFNDQKNAGGIKVFSNAWSDFDALNPYFNRVWLRISNRGIVPGPAFIQAFYGDSYTRTDFVPSLARDETWEQIIGQATLATGDKYVQNRFMTFDAPVGGVYTLHAVSAIPALSGYSTPGATKSYTLVEFKWHISSLPAEYPPSDKRHGCLTAFINQPPYFTTNIDTARRWDLGPLEGTPDTLDPNVSIWPITAQANNVTVKNTNIVFGEDPGTSSNYNPLLKTTINENDDPVNFRKSPVYYKLTFAKRNALWGLRVDGREFKNGELIIKISKMIAENIKLRNFKEITEYDVINNEIHMLKEKLAKKNLDVAHIKPEELIKIKNNQLRIKPFRFFVLTKGAIGEIQNLKAFITTKKDIFIKNTFFHLYFKPDVGIKKGLYKVKVEELANNRVVGGYETIIDIVDQKIIKFVGDERKMVAYKAEKKIFDEKVIPHQYRVPFIGAGYINNEYYKLIPEERKKLTNPINENELANFDKGVLSKKELTKYKKILGDKLK